MCDQFNPCATASKNNSDASNSMEGNNVGVPCCLDVAHKGHRMDPLEETSEIKNKKLEELTSEREETERRIQRLEEQRRQAQENTAGVTERVITLCKDIRRQLEDLERRVLSDISRWQEQISQLASDQIQQLEIKKNELSRRIRHIEELSSMTGPLAVLQESDTEDFCDADNNLDIQSRKEEQLHWTSDSLITVTLYSKLADIWSAIKKRMFADITFDADTVGRRVALSKDLKTLYFSEKEEDYPEAAERFEHSQALSSQSFSSGRHYWEVENSGSGSWVVGLCYPSIDRRGEWSFIGDNHRSWGLCAVYNQYSVMHDSTESKIEHSFSCRRIGVFLDYEAGQLSFYELCEPVRHLYTFTTTFSEPLHAAFYVWDAWLKVRE